VFCSMGFPKKLIIEALKQTDNNQESSLNLLVNSPFLLTKKPKNLDNKVQQLSSMGFSPSLALGTLQSVNGNLQKAIELCLSGKGVESSVVENSKTIQESIENDKQLITNEKSEELSTIKEQKQTKVAEEDLVLDLNQEDDDYLDVDLADEEAILKEYQILIYKLT